MNASTALVANDDVPISRPARVRRNAPVEPTLFNLVAQAARDPRVDAEKLRALYDLQRTIIADEAKVQFYRALGAFSAEVPQIGKAGKTDRYKFARREDMDEIIRPLLVKHGLVLSFRPIASTLEAITVEGELVHVASGFAKRAEFTLPPDFGPGRNNLQAFGSSKAYAERYLTEMLCGLVRCDEDNDGKRAPANTNENTGELISRAQAAELRALMQETRILESVVLAKKAPGLATIEALPATQFHIVRNDLLSRRNVLAQRAAADAQFNKGAAA